MHKRCREIMDELILNGELEEITWFKFAPKQELKLRLKDMLEDEVDKKYHLSQEAISYMGRERQGKPRWEFHKNEVEGIAACLTANMHKGVPYGVITPYLPIRLEQTHTLNIKGNDSIKRIYSSDGLCPSLTTMQGGGHREPKIAHPVREVGRRLDIYGKRCDDNKAIPITRRYEIGEKEISNCLSGVQKDSYVAIVNEAIEIENDEVNKYKISKTIKPSVAKNIQIEMSDILKSPKDFYVCKTDAGWQDNKIGLKTSPTIRANNSSIYGLDRANYIFRKLTPRECFRLQGFDDSFIFPPKMSDTQLYKQAGNGMSRNILDMIFTQIFKSKNFDLSSNS